MSRTYKDRPYRLKHESWNKDRYMLETEADGFFHRYNYLWTKTTKTKKRKEQDTEDHWMTTPGWWIHLLHTRPQRRKYHTQEIAVLKLNDLEEVDFVNYKRKPHWYYW